MEYQRNPSEGTSKKCGERFVRESMGIMFVGIVLQEDIIFIVTSE